MLDGDTEKARTVYLSLVKDTPSDPLGYFKMGLLEEKSKNYDESREVVPAGA